jgi:hypothetical protein
MPSSFVVLKRRYVRPKPRTLRVRAGEESDRPPSRDLVERTARKVEKGSAGLPVGVQVAARHWREDIVLAVMSALEEYFRQQSDYPVSSATSRGAATECSHGRQPMEQR